MRKPVTYLVFVILFSPFKMELAYYWKKIIQSCFQPHPNPLKSPQSRPVVAD